MSSGLRIHRGLPLLSYVPWNLTSRLAPFREADAIVLSLGKSGRTWLRVMLHHALALEYGIPFDPIGIEPGESGAPRIVYTHELATHLRDATLRNQLLGKSILPRWLTDRKRLVVLARDPRDVVISSYFHKTERSRKTDCSLEEFLHHPRWGIEGLVMVLNRWRVRFAALPHCHWLSYEGLHRDPQGELLRLLASIGAASTPGVVAAAVEAARFDRMKAAEAAGESSDTRLRPGDATRPDSFKVRRGRVGGYRDDLGPEAIAYVDAAVARLDPFFGYGPTGEPGR
ncbi:MAG: sulfotransferase domain-containing protein [Burkholderiales bacterium]|nr:sulfotransferase domain-containing protein [Burkholderiales bacterium]